MGSEQGIDRTLGKKGGIWIGLCRLSDHSLMKGSTCFLRLLCGGAEESRGEGQRKAEVWRRLRELLLSRAHAHRERKSARRVGRKIWYWRRSGPIFVEGGKAAMRLRFEIAWVRLIGRGTSRWVVTLR